ncbi:LppX_LprAFG lipoprotein [Streptomyces sp. NPDC021096]|uniref:LppX_LprAFG lipoprotein n=1 Tax=Streptomyces sp. NPDC021096 TaxID=3154792 RepID=UPI003405FA95
MVLVAGLALSLTACGGDEGDKQDPVFELAAAAEKAAKQNSYKAKGLSKDHEGETSIEASYSEKPAASDLRGTGPKTADNPSGEVRMVHIGDTLYVKSGEPVGGKTWMKFQGGKLAEIPKGDSLRSAGLQAAVLTTSKNLKKAGDESVRGRKTTHYKGTVVLSDLAAYKGDLMTEKQRDAYVRTSKIDDVKSLEMDVWVDKEGLPAKTSESAKGSKGETITIMEYLEYGLEVKVQAPPSDEVASMADMLKSMPKQ